MMSKREARDPHQPHWHIGPIGVRPERQGHGIGKALLTVVLTTVDEAAIAWFLETDVDRNVELYERFGFTVTSREDIVGVDTRFMWREIQQAPSNARTDARLRSREPSSVALTLRSARRGPARLMTFPQCSVRQGRRELSVNSKDLGPHDRNAPIHHGNMLFCQQETVDPLWP